MSKKQESQHDALAHKQAHVQAVTENNDYEQIRQRLNQQGAQLEKLTAALNTARLTEFSSANAMEVMGQAQLLTKNKGIARDIVQAGNYVLFAQNPQRVEQKVIVLEDVFSLYQPEAHEEKPIALKPLALEDSFLTENSFSHEFGDIFAYYQYAQLSQLRVEENKLLIAFQIGEDINDVRVFRWLIDLDGELSYLDNRGKADIRLPDPLVLTWQAIGHDDIVHGREPYLMILDTLLIKVLAGQLTLEISPNQATDLVAESGQSGQSGQGSILYRETLSQRTQSLDDSKVFYAVTGQLIIIKLLPYLEQTWRYLVFNRTHDQVQRIDSIGQSCQLLPEKQGLIFPDGFYLQSGLLRHFEGDTAGMQFSHRIRSPNGEDVLYVFYHPQTSHRVLLCYNLIEQTLRTPLFVQGYALNPNGTMVLLTIESVENSKHTKTSHAVQIWQTPFVSDEVAQQQPINNTFYARIGNVALVRGIADLYRITRRINNPSVSVAHYTQLIQQSQRLFERYYWLEKPPLEAIKTLMNAVVDTTQHVVDEFKKAEVLRLQAIQALQTAQQEQQAILSALLPETWHEVDEFVAMLNRIRQQRGHLMSIAEYRYMDQQGIAPLDAELMAAQEQLGAETIQFLASEHALQPYHSRVTALAEALEHAKTSITLAQVLQKQEKIATDLDVLSELITTLNADDAVLQTKVMDDMAEIYAKLNQLRAHAVQQQQQTGKGEATAQFGVQFTLLMQSMSNALGLARSPEQCDEQLSRVLIQLEVLEGKFSQYDEFLSDMVEKRDEIHQAFEAKKQALLNERQLRAQTLFDAAQRMIVSIQHRTDKITQLDELNAFFATDSLMIKLREISQQLRELGDNVKADDLESSFKNHQEQAIRTLRDKQDLYEDGNTIIRLGSTHRFSVSTQELDVSLIVRDETHYVHINGTDFLEPIDREGNGVELAALKPYWQQPLASETADFYRAEYLAGQLLAALEKGEISQQALEQDGLKTVRQFAASRYKEGYENGIHDHDALQILTSLLAQQTTVGLLRFDPLARSIAVIFWSMKQAQLGKHWQEQAKAASEMTRVFNDTQAQQQLQHDIESAMSQFFKQHTLTKEQAIISRAAAYLCQELAQEQDNQDQKQPQKQACFVISSYAQPLVDQLQQRLQATKAWERFTIALQTLKNNPSQCWHYLEAWFNALLKNNKTNRQAYIPEAISLLMLDDHVARYPLDVELMMRFDQLRGDHPLIETDDNTRYFERSFDQFLNHYHVHCQQIVPHYQQYAQLCKAILQQQRQQLRLETFKPLPLSSFVRNKLLNEAYLPLIGDNLAKQIGTVGQDKRTDLMGLLLLISPPGYGKTTLMEYIANRLGLVFMKINGPALGAKVVSLDPAQAPDKTAQQELIKLNLALKMGNNVMLYIDDIQHTHPEFLQKFIALADGTRRIEGIWQQESKTYDMRGKRFCLIMAGNPYTELGERFTIPDMLANRADSYNLGDILGDYADIFALSYLENCLTSNAILAPLAHRDMNDVYALIAMAQGKQVSRHDLSYAYSTIEQQEITAVFKHLLVIQNIVLKVNQHYIASAEQNEEYRTEPPFKLQGSYRNMNKMAERVTAAMNHAELLQLITDHYQSEAQLLTVAAEENLLKLAELRGTMTETEQCRWETIKHAYYYKHHADTEAMESKQMLLNTLSDISAGVQVMGGNLRELSVTSTQRLNWLVTK